MRKGKFRFSFSDLALYFRENFIYLVFGIAVMAAVCAVAEDFKALKNFFSSGHCEPFEVFLSFIHNRSISNSKPICQ